MQSSSQCLYWLSISKCHSKHTHKHTHSSNQAGSQSRQERAQRKLKSRHSLSVLFPPQSFSSSVLLARRIFWRTTFRSVSIFLQGLQALVEPFDAQRHIVTRDSDSRGSIEVRTGVFLRVRHEAAERVSADGLLLAQRYYPGNVWKTSNDKYSTWQETTSIYYYLRWAIHLTTVIWIKYVCP